VTNARGTGASFEGGTGTPATVTGPACAGARGTSGGFVPVGASGAASGADAACGGETACGRGVAGGWGAGKADAAGGLGTADGGSAADALIGAGASSALTRSPHALQNLVPARSSEAQCGHALSSDIDALGWFARSWPQPSHRRAPGGSLAPQDGQ
jgi:hypothetical protein